MRDAARHSAVDSERGVQVPESAPASITPGISGLSNSNDSASKISMFAAPEPTPHGSNTSVSAGVIVSNTLVLAEVISSNTSMSAPLEGACYICDDPMSVIPRNTITQQEFHSPVEDRTSLLQSMDLEPSGILTYVTK